MTLSRRHLGLGVLAIVAAGLVCSCQAVFTFSPLSFLQRDPQDMSPEEQLSFAEDALASGDAEAVADAYDAIQDAVDDDPENPELQYMAGQLALEMSGVGDVMEGLLSGGDLAVDDTVWEEFSDQELDRLGEAGDYLLAADALGADLTPTDYLVGAVGLLIAGAEPNSDVTETADTNPNKDEAVQFLTQGIAELPEGDPAADMLQQLLDSINA